MGVPDVLVEVSADRLGGQQARVKRGAGGWQATTGRLLRSSRAKRTSTARKRAAVLSIVGGTIAFMGDACVRCARETMAGTGGGGGSRRVSRV